MPKVRKIWAERQFVKSSYYDQVDFCPFRGPDAPFAPGDLSTNYLSRWR